MAGLGAGEVVELVQSWTAEEVDRIRVVVDEENVVPEANDDDNEAEHGLEVAYAAGFGWRDSYRENPLAWLFSIVGLILISLVGTVAQRTAIDHGEGAFFDDEEEAWGEEDFDEEDDDEDDEFDD